MTPVRLLITGLSPTGAGVARRGSKVVFVTGALPGEEVLARITSETKMFERAEVVAMEKTSAERELPSCKYFGTCGGCTMQHLSIASQRSWKRQFISDSFRRLAFGPGMSRHSTAWFDVVVEQCRGAEKEGYRSKLTPRVIKDGEVGFAGVDKGTVVAIKECKMATAGVNAAIEGLAKTARVANTRLLIREGDGVVATNSRDVLTQTINGSKFQFKAGGFFQINAGVTQILAAHVVECVRGYGGIVDTHCGVGLLSICIATQAEVGVRVVGTELDEDSVAFARTNARANGVGAICDFVACDAAESFKGVEFKGERVCVVADPPRAGLSKKYIRELLKFKPDRFVYVSCDVGTQARDSRALLEEGEYVVQEVTPFDMFPHTSHVESVAVFDRVQR